MADDPLVDDDVLEQPTTASTEAEGLSNQVQVIRSSRQYNLALLSLIGMLLFTTAMLFFVDVNKIAALEPVVVWFFAGTTSVVTAYFGFNAWSYIKNPHAGKSG